MCETKYNKRVSGSGFQPTPKSPSATSDNHHPLDEIYSLKEEIIYGKTI